MCSQVTDGCNQIRIENRDCSCYTFSLSCAGGALALGTGAAVEVQAGSRGRWFWHQQGAAEFSLVPCRMLNPRVVVALADASRSCLDVGLHGQIVAIALCSTGALGFASAAIANVVFAGG